VPRCFGLRRGRRHQHRLPLHALTVLHQGFWLFLMGRRIRGIMGEVTSRQAETGALSPRLFLRVIVPGSIHVAGAGQHNTARCNRLTASAVKQVTGHGALDRRPPWCSLRAVHRGQQYHVTKSSLQAKVYRP
jgi:hypothetical protein